MPRYRHALPQLDGGLYLTDGGLETTLIFHEGVELPEFAAFALMDIPGGQERLIRYFERYIAIAREFGAGFVLESTTWRANPDWAAKLNYSPAMLADVNLRSIALLEELRARHADHHQALVISGCLGPRGDGYRVGGAMNVDEACEYHSEQMAVFARTDADLASAITMTYAEEAAGIVIAARAAGMPVVVSFTVETDGRLPSGQPLAEAIAQVDALSEDYPAYYMLNCAHPTHFAHVLGGGAWTDRIRGLRANSSCKSHAELDESTEPDEGNPEELGSQYAVLLADLPALNVLGGCCGTDHRHLSEIAKACAPLIR